MVSNKNACGDKVIGGGCGRRAAIQIVPRMSIITAMSTGMAIMSTIIMMCMSALLQTAIPGSETVFR